MTHIRKRAFVFLCCAAALLANMSAEGAAAQGAHAATYARGPSAIAPVVPLAVIHAAVTRTVKPGRAVAHAVPPDTAGAYAVASHTGGAHAVAASQINWRTALLYAAPVRLPAPSKGACSVVLQPAPRSPAHSAAHEGHRVQPAPHTHPSILFCDSVNEMTDPMQPHPRQDRWLAYDKVQHFVVSFLWTLASQYFFVAKLGMSEGTALPLSMLSSASAGAAKEIYDWRHPDEQTASMRDLAADAAGIVVAGGVILL